MNLTRLEREEQKKERLGKININNEGCKMIIIEYNSATNVVIEFQDEHRTKIKTTWNNFKIGRIKNPYFKDVFGIGYSGQGKYKAKVNKKETEAYKYWRHMLMRCYDPYYLNKQPSYIDAYVCEEWHNFQNFAEWFYKHYYEIKNERMHLDKDILIKGNKIYSPKTCIFVPQRINNLFLRRQSCRGKYPIGVSIHSDKERLCAICHIHIDGKNKLKHLGCFPLDKPFQAFTSYKNFKENYIKKVADEYKELIPKKLYDALYNYKVEIND